MRTSFTVAIPTHNRRPTALLAVRSALQQLRAPEQVIVLCDGCDDGTADAVSTLGDDRALALDLPKGPGFAYAHRNRALELAEGDVVLWLADDDLLLPDHLERVGELWDSGRFDIVLSRGAVVFPDDSIEWMGHDWSVPRFRALEETVNTNPMSTVSLRTELARSIGGWDGALPRAADWDLFRRALAAGARPASTAEPTVLHFRATGRDQDWDSRVAQNTAWFGDLGDPQRLIDMKVRLRRSRDERDAALEAHWEGVEVHRQTLQAEADAMYAELESLRPRLNELQVELGLTRSASVEDRPG